MESTCAEKSKEKNEKVTTVSLRKFAQKSSHIEICFISSLKLGHKLLIPKMKKNWGGHRLCFGEKRQGKNAIIPLDKSS